MCRISSDLLERDFPVLCHWRTLKLKKSVHDPAQAAFKDAAPNLSPRRPSTQNLQAMLRGYRKEIEQLSKRLAEGDITPRVWGEAFKQVLNRGHMNAWALGRQRAGNLAPVGFDDALLGVAIADTQNPFLLRFIDDIVQGRYTDDDGKLKLGAIQQRSDLYLHIMGGTANQAFVAASDDEEDFIWDLSGAVEKHCTDCPQIASMSPWPKSGLFVFPRDGQTPCLGNCKCRLVRASDKQSGFGPVTLAA